jgi:hypothetical protein
LSQNYYSAVCGVLEKNNLKFPTKLILFFNHTAETDRRLPPSNPLECPHLLLEAVTPDPPPDLLGSPFFGSPFPISAEKPLSQTTYAAMAGGFSKRQLQADVVHPSIYERAS